MTEPILRILIADDHTIVRKGLVALLATPRFGFEVVGEAADGIQAVELARTLAPDVLLMDLIMPRMDGVEATRAILAQDPGVRVLILTSAPASERAIEVIRAGARGFLEKDSSPDDLIRAIRTVAAGQTLIPSTVLEALAAGDNALAHTASTTDQLTGRESTILALIAQGLSNKEIASRLQLSPHTVRAHARTIFEKIGVTNRTQAALYAVENGLVILGDG